MAFIFYLSITTLIIPSISQVFTQITAGVPWTDIPELQYYQSTYTNALTEFGDGNYWFYPEYKAVRTGDGNGLGGMVSTLPQTGAPVWGWWGRWGQCIGTPTCLNTDDPDRSMSRYFSCSSAGTVAISMDIYMCLDTGSPGWKNIGGTTNIYYARTSSTSGDISTTYKNYAEQSSGWSTTGSGVIGTTGNCDATIRKKTITDPGFATNGPGERFSITLNWEASGENWGQSYHVAAMNNLVITCNQIPTKGPTQSPTATTGTPTATPSKTPSQTPSKYPSKYPTQTPSKYPTTAEPSQSPTTPIPSKNPTQTPSKTPTQYPTTDPTEVPTVKPTGRPSPGPTHSPNVRRSFSEQWGDAFGGSDYECHDGWVSCNLLVFIILLVIVIFCLLYWILGGVWYKRRQDNRPLPAYMMKDAGGDGNVEMGTGAPKTHATSNKWKSAWEQEQEAKANQGGGNDGW